MEGYQLAYVSSGRELVHAEGEVPKPDSNLLLVANPAFDRNKALEALGSCLALTHLALATERNADQF